MDRNLFKSNYHVTYKIELSVGCRIFMSICFSISIIGMFLLMAIPFPLLPRVIVFMFFLLLSYHFLMILQAKVKIYRSNIYVVAGIFIHKEILFKDIKCIYTVDYNKVSIPKDNPALSQNVIAIEYKESKIIYISIKKKDEFVKLIDKLIVE